MLVRFWLVLGLCWGDHEQFLAVDDECQSGDACALEALQLRRASTEVDHLQTLCSKADGVCSLLSGSVEHRRKTLTLSDLQELLAVAPSTFRAFADAVQLRQERAVEGDRLDCQKLCQISAQLLSREGFALPPAPDIGCYQDAKGRDICSEDLSPKTLATRFASPDDLQGQSRPPSRKKAEKLHRQVRSSIRVEDPYQHGVEALVKSYSSELALRVLYMFRVYPRAFNTYLAAPQAEPTDWQSRLAKFNLVARVFVMNAIRNLRLHKTVLQIAKWFGDQAIAGSSLNDTRVELLRVLNSAVHVMNTAEFIYNATGCEDSTFAFVYPSAYDGIPDLTESFRKNQKGQFVVYVCPLTVYAERLGILAEAVQTTVHESSHHAVAYLDDVATCPQSHYVWMDATGLPTLKGSNCPFGGDDQPRFSIGGKTCEVPGSEIWRLANITRPAYVRGLRETARCSSNLAALLSAGECQAAAAFLGAEFLGPEEDPGWPKGCYEISAGPWEGVYFNNASVGSAVGAARPLCATLPFQAPLEAGRCPAHYTQLQAGGDCELDLPYFRGPKMSTACPPDSELVYFPKNCRSAADVLGLPWGGSVTNPSDPPNCIVKNELVVFNSDEGYGSDAAPMCRRTFSYSVLDPRVSYSIGTLRFSQTGDAALFKVVAAEASSDDCEVAYGRAKCKDLASQDPSKALMNADSFGYYVLDAGNPETFEA